jgi:hypothetical protein
MAMLRDVFSPMGQRVYALISINNPQGMRRNAHAIH